MNKHTLKVLEYEKVKSIVASFAASEAGRTAIEGLEPSSDEQTVVQLQKETAEFVGILQSGQNAPLDGIPESEPTAAKLGISNSMLAPLELLNLARTLAAGRRLKKFFQQFEGKGTDRRFAAPLLCSQANRLQPLREIEDAILDAIDDRAEIKDSASPEFRKIRRQIVRMREDILGRMGRILQQESYQKVIQEPVITLRDDRYVLPLKPNFRQSLSGVVHGQSGSRATLFVEPLDVLEQNNRLAELRMEEREEVERILRGLTALASREASSIRQTIEVLAFLDAVHARARFGIEYHGVVPEVSRDGSVSLLAAVHPLLIARSRGQSGHGKVMPNDIRLEPGQRALIVSGPNAGGKTVILKTAGLLCLMAQSGLPVTAADGSRLPCFSSVYADIGDDQSLEQDLSTFSSHVGRVAEILRDADRTSLVLLDELGSGTEPGEGSGLGAAVLEHLIEQGCLTIVTTHHNALKLFGAQTHGALNAAMEFDPGSLKPTYRMIAGRPGRSYGLDMAARMGIPDEVIRKARSRISEDNVNLDLLLRQVEEDARRISAEREALERELKAAEQNRNEAAAQHAAAREEAREVKTKARIEAREVLSALRQKLRELGREAVRDQQEIRKSRAEVEALSSRLDSDARTEKPRRADQRRIFHAGDRVRIERFDKTGTVIASSSGILELEVGAKKIKLPADEVTHLEKLPKQKNNHTTSGWSTELLEEEGARDRLNIIGLRVPEALAELDRFIDQAGLHHLTVVVVIHGLGTGALKTAVTDFLKQHPLVATFRSGEAAEGSAGVTVVELKK